MTLHVAAVMQQGHGVNFHILVMHTCYQPEWHSHASQIQEHRQRKRTAACILPVPDSRFSTGNAKLHVASACQGAVGGAVSEAALLYRCVSSPAVGTMALSSHVDVLLHNPMCAQHHQRSLPWRCAVSLELQVHVSVSRPAEGETAAALFTVHPFLPGPGNWHAVTATAMLLAVHAA